MIRVLLADDQDLVRAGLRMLCESQADIEVVGEASNGAQALRLTSHVLPDVVLMDLQMPTMDGITATRLILQARPATRILVLTTFDDDEHLYPALAGGACGFLTKDAAPAQLLDGIRRAAAGESPYSGAVLRRLIDSAIQAKTTQASGEPEPEMTPREREVLAFVGMGMSNNEIAAHLGIGLTTVKTHVARLMERTEVRNRVHLALLAVRHHITHQ